ncbi:MAG: hypothetical protein ABI426_05230 [Flavobacterium sp.]
MSPAKKKATVPKKVSTNKKTEPLKSNTKLVTSKQGLKKKLNEFGDEDSF